MDYRKTHGRKNWKYQQNKKHNKRDLELAKRNLYLSGIRVDWDWDENGHMTPMGKYVKRPKTSTARVYCKKQTSRKIRRTKIIINGNAYRKYFDMWWTLQ